MRARANRDYDVGYGKAPGRTRFEKGRSGNPKGRPKGRKSTPPYDAVLGQLVTVREGSVERKMTAAEAFLLHITKRGLDGDGAAARSAMAAIEEARARRGPDIADHLILVWCYVTPGSVNSALEPLRMAVKHDRYRETARMLLEPWIVEEALSRLGERRLTTDEQAKVFEATRTPRKVNWPEWWEMKG